MDHVERGDINEFWLIMVRRVFLQCEGYMGKLYYNLWRIYRWQKDGDHDRYECLARYYMG